VLSPSGRQTVTVRAEDDPHDLTKPRGKQDWHSSRTRSGTRATTGIWQSVWWESRRPHLVEKIRWTPHVETYAIGLDVRVGGRPGRGSRCRGDAPGTKRGLHGARPVQVVNREADRIIVSFRSGHRGLPQRAVVVAPERPTLLDARIRLMCGDRVLDESVPTSAFAR
jgi:hypothetical protein